MAADLGASREWWNCVIRIETYDDLSRVDREWDELAERLDASPFLRPGWIAAWGAAFARGRLTVVTARRNGGEVLGVVPLQRRGDELRSASNEHSPEFGFLAADREVAARLAHAVYDGTSISICLDFVDPNDVAIAECRDVGKWLAYRRDERLRLRSPYLTIEGDWAQYASGRRRKPRSEAERRLRRLSESGAVTFEVADGSDRLDDLLDQGFAVEASGWKGERGTAIAARSETRTFYTAVAHWAADRGWLRLAFLRLDGRSLAFVLGLEANGVFYSVKEGFDPGFGKFGPGALLRYRLIARAFSLGLRRYEFLGDAEPWKLEWTDTWRERTVFRAYAPSLRGYLKWSLHVRARRAAERVPFARKLRRLLAR